MAGAPRKTVAQSVEVDGLKETLRAFNKYPKQASEELRRAAMDIAAGTADEARGRGSAWGGVRALAAESITVKRDRTPSLSAGGSKRLGSRKHPAGAFFFGAEFGGQGRKSTRQFPPYLGKLGYFLWPTVRMRKRADHARYLRAMDAVGKKWANGR